MRYKISNGETVVNTIESDPAFVESYCAELGYTYEEIPVTPHIPEPEPTDTDVLNTLLGVSE